MSAATTISPGWFSIEGAAIYTGFSVPSIRTAIDDGSIPHSRVSVKKDGPKASVRMRKEHLDAWIEGKPIRQTIDAAGQIERHARFQEGLGTEAGKAKAAGYRHALHVMRLMGAMPVPGPAELAGVAGGPLSDLELFPTG